MQNIFTVIGTTHDARPVYPAQQAQIIPSMGDAGRFKIPARSKLGMFGFSCVDYKDQDLSRNLFHGNRCVVLLQTTRGGVVYFQDVFFDWDCQMSLNNPEGDPPGILTADSRSFRYGYYCVSPSGSSGGAYGITTPFAGFETVIALALYDVGADTYAGGPGSTLSAPSQATLPYPTGTLALYSGNASGITFTT